MTGRFPRQFGKYLLLKPLAKGGMGEIYLAAGGDVGGFEKLCVIKKVITEKSDQTKANRFLDEAKVGLRLSHSGLVSTFDVGEVNGEFYIAMELVEGKDLREVWNRCVRTRQRIPLDVALFVSREVARALSYVHSYGDLKLVHRDVAPPNILLAYVGDVKLTDFGLARSVLKQEHTAPGVVFGRAAYLAPEQARGEVADARTDVYTLGIVLWELLTGQQFLQLGGLDPAAALALVRHPRQTPPSARAPWITPALDQVALKALAPDREKRFQSAEELRQALSAVIAEIAPTADSSRVSEFLHSIYAETIVDERQERERFLKTEIPTLRSALAHGVRLEGERLRTPAHPPTPAVPADTDAAQAWRVDTNGNGVGTTAEPPHLPGMTGSYAAVGEGHASDLSARAARAARRPSSPTLETPASVSAQLREQIAAEIKTLGLPSDGGAAVSFLSAPKPSSAAATARREAAAAVAVVQKSNEDRRLARRQAALRVVADLAAGPSSKAHEPPGRRRRPSRPPPLPTADPVAAMPSPFVTPPAPITPAVSRPTAEPPPHDLAILTSATPSVAAAATRPAVPPPPLPPAAVAAVTLAPSPPSLPPPSSAIASHNGAPPPAYSWTGSGEGPGVPSAPSARKTLRMVAMLAAVAALVIVIIKLM